MDGGPPLGALCPQDVRCRLPLLVSDAINDGKHAFYNIVGYPIPEQVAMLHDTCDAVLCLESTYTHALFKGKVLIGPYPRRDIPEARLPVEDTVQVPA